MRFVVRSFVATLATVAMFGYTLSAHAGLYTTAGAPASSLTLEIWVGPPGGEIPGSDDGEGNPVPSILGSTIGPLGVNGTANITLSIDGLGNGSVSFDSSNLLVDNVNNQFVDLVTGVPDGGILTTYLDLIGVGVGVNSTAIPVSGGVWDLDGIGAPSSLGVALDQGFLSLHDHGGPIGGFLDEPTEIDLTADPVSVELADLLGLGIHGAADPSLVSFIIPAIDLDLGASLGLTGLLYVRLLGEINLVPVPEPGSVVLFGMGLVGLVAIGRRRFRKS